MKSAATITFLLFALVAAPAFAQGKPVDWTLWGSGVDIGDNDLGDGFSMESESGVGMGLSANFFVSDKLSIELAIFGLRSDAGLLFDGLGVADDDDGFEMGNVELIPVTFGLQYHFLAGSRWDPYIGAGGAWISASDIESDDLDILGIGAIEVDDEFTYFANAGVGFHFTDSVGLAIDFRYMNYEPTTTSKVTGVSQDLDLSPLVGSLGLRLRF